jgi:lysophospholipase L1-like esterase
MMSRALARPVPARLVAVTVLTFLLALCWPPATADAATKQLVALGDSYSSGVGTRSYYADSGSCRRSPYAYPVLDAARVGAALSFQSCSGATTSSVLNNQLGSLTASTSYVTISVGGNDASFSDVLTECAQPWWSSDCDGAIDQAQATISNTLPGRLDTLYNAIRSRATSAKVVVVGYPRIFNGEDCNAATFFSPAEETRLNQTADLLDTRIRGSAWAHGYSFVDPRTSFTGHAVCDDPEWINGLSNPIAESYHPNRTGQSSGYANLVDDYLV